MKKIILIAAGCILTYALSAQTPTATPVKIMDSATNDKYWVTWLNDLYEMGVVMENDSIKINAEVRQIILDSNFRKFIYPPVYTWASATTLIKGMELKKGFWYLINLYGSDTANRKLIIETLLSFDKIMDIQKVLVGTFYTYAMLDPKLCSVKNGKPVITRPDMLEKEFGQLKEMIGYINYYRNEKKG